MSSSSSMYAKKATFITGAKTRGNNKVDSPTTRAAKALMLFNNKPDKGILERKDSSESDSD